MKSSKAESLAEGRKIPGQLTVQISTQLFGLQILGCSTHSWKNQIPLCLSYNVFEPSLKDIARRRSGTFARISRSERRSVLKLEGVISSKASEDVPLTLQDNKCLILIKIHSFPWKWCIYEEIWRILSTSNSQLKNYISDGTHCTNISRKNYCTQLILSSFFAFI